MTTAAPRATIQTEPYSARPQPGVTSTGPDPATIASRVRTLAKVADRYHELTEPPAPGGGRGNGDRLALTPHERLCMTVTTKGRGRRCTCAYRTVHEFTRLMGEMRDDKTPIYLVRRVTETGPVWDQVTRERYLDVRLQNASGDQANPTAVHKLKLHTARWHLMGFHVDAHRVVKHHPAPLKKGQRMRKPTDEQQILRDRHGNWIPTVTTDHVVPVAGARKDFAAFGLAWMAKRWAGETEPELPADVAAGAKAA